MITASGTAGWAARIAAQTPPHRDRTVDALRAAAILGVVLGHWLVSALVSTPDQPAVLTEASPLSALPAFAPVTWVLETLGPFFFAGGYAAARAIRGRKPLPWLASRVSRLLRPVLVLAAVWLPALALLAGIDAPRATQHVVWTVVSQPMWFLLVYLVLTVLTPALRAATVRYGLWVALPGIALVALTDAVRSPGLPNWLMMPTTLAGWAVPYLLGIALAEGRLTDRAGRWLLPLGVAGGAGLVLAAHYPASAVGVPGVPWSNLSPPSLFALALAAAQLGAFLLARGWLARHLRRPAVWAPVALLNLTAMTVYCWHQSALLLVSLAGQPAGRLPGLLDTPAGFWPVHRLLWLPLFALVLAGLTRLFHPVEGWHRGSSRGRPRARPDIPLS